MVFEVNEDSNISRPAAAAIAERVFAVINSSGQAALASAGGYIDGVNRYQVTAAGDECTLETEGNPLITAGGTFSAGDPLMSDSAGKAVAWTSGNVAVGRALSDGSSGALARMMLYERAQSYVTVFNAGIDPLVAVSASGAISVPTADTTYFVTKSSAIAVLTIVDPTATTHDGLRLSFISVTAQAHTLSNAAGSGFNAGGASTDVGTFGGAKGDNIVIQAYQGKWYVRSSVNVTLS